MKEVEIISNVKKAYGIDIPVLLIFFCRDEQLECVFKEIKKARPSKLYLYQDGARVGNENDKRGILACRKIVKDIDWECEVHKWFQAENIGCDPSEYLAQKWMFETEKMGIVLEDDDVPSQSFFRYCKELLEKYYEDERVHQICGANNCEVLKQCSTSYVFTKLGHCTGWATWKREVDLWDSEYKWLNDKYVLENIRSQMSSDEEYKTLISTCIKHRDSGKEHYETIGGMGVYLYNKLNIVPAKNMISNIGYGVAGTHSTSDIRVLPRRIRRWANVPRYEIEFPLVHPQYYLMDKEFEKGITFNKFEKFVNKWECRFLQLRYQDIRHILYKIKSRL